MVLASRAVTSAVEICSSCGGKRPTVSTRASRKAFRSLLTSSFANCPVAVYSVSTASSSLFDISPPQSFVTSLTEIDVREEPLFLFRLFQVLLSLSHHSVFVSPPPVPLRPRGVVFRSLSSERGPPTLTGEKGGLTWRVTPTHHEPGPGLASLQHAALPWRPPQRCRGDITSESYDSREARERRSSQCPFTSIRGYGSN